jgi:hypothetical protein
MKIKMLVGISGSLDGQPYPPRGGEWEVNDVAGAQLCAKGLAKPVAEKEPVETAVEPEPEKRSPAHKTASKQTAESDKK